jgi:hypothetical protein
MVKDKHHLGHLVEQTHLRSPRPRLQCISRVRSVHAVVELPICQETRYPKTGNVNARPLAA